MKYWLVKTEPDTYAWGDLMRDKKGVWDGVRNFQARKNLNSMDKGDTVLIYHTGEEKAVVGIAAVARGPYPEPQDPQWVAVDLVPKKALKKPVSLAAIKKDKSLQKMVLVKAARLSVQPVADDEFKRILELSASA